MTRIMSREQINQISGRFAVALSLIALLTVISGYFQPPQTDEGAAAHILQIAVAAFVPAVLTFLATFSGKGPRRSGRPIFASGALLIVAFGALYYLEHFR